MFIAAYFSYIMTPSTCSYLNKRLPMSLVCNIKIIQLNRLLNFVGCHEFCQKFLLKETFLLLHRQKSQNRLDQFAPKHLYSGVHLTKGSLTSSLESLVMTGWRHKLAGLIYKVINFTRRYGYNRMFSHCQTNVY